MSKMDGKKRYKAIFGNPPYSIPNKEGTGKNILWNRFSEESLRQAEEVYYITPYIWNGRAKRIIRENSISKIDLTASDHFSVGSSICYWNNHQSGKKEIHTGNKVFEINNLSDVEYLPLDIDNTFSIHKKLWDKGGIMGFRVNIKILYDEIRTTKSEEYRYAVYSTNRYKIKYTNEESIKKYGEDLFHTPKIMVGFTRDNSPFYDREGEYATEAMAYYLLDSVENLDIRYKQLGSKLAKFYAYTARQEKCGGRTGMAMYRKAMRKYPDIPLNITTDEGIYKWLGLTDTEIGVVEMYAAKTDQQAKKRQEKHNNRKKVEINENNYEKSEEIS